MVSVCHMGGMVKIPGVGGDKDARYCQSDLYCVVDDCALHPPPQACWLSWTRIIDTD